jgi:hypothetical protein
MCLLQMFHDKEMVLENVNGFSSTWNTYMYGMPCV